MKFKPLSVLLALVLAFSVFSAAQYASAPTASSTPTPTPTPSATAPTVSSTPSATPKPTSSPTPWPTNVPNGGKCQQNSQCAGFLKTQPSCGSDGLHPSTIYSTCDNGVCTQHTYTPPAPHNYCVQGLDTCLIEPNGNGGSSDFVPGIAPGVPVARCLAQTCVTDAQCGAPFCVNQNGKSFSVQPVCSAQPGIPEGNFRCNISQRGVTLCANGCNQANGQCNPPAAPKPGSVPPAPTTTPWSTQLVGVLLVLMVLFAGYSLFSSD